MKWHSRKFTSSNSHVPAALGLYAIEYFSAIQGLTVGTEIVYVGQARNLRRRLSQHNAWIEVNPGLEEFIRRKRSNIRIWYTTELFRDELDPHERELIRTIKPRFNRKGYKED